ncbi:MAG: putative quinol monooxygenase [Nitriliruptor sp.]|uniref:putative quinol monooxygenase n=1 Tax=Nitriliruptor sp. TaxID=2448056 RepID=UPI00349FE250
MAGYTLCGSIRATPGDGDRLEALLLEAADAVAPADGCRLYLVNRSQDDPDAVWIVEVWRDQDAHEASLHLAGVQDVIGRARPLIAGMGDRTELRLVGGIGLDGPAATAT